MAATTAALVQQYVTLSTHRKNKEADVEAIKGEMAKIEEELLGRFERASTTSMKVANQLVYIRKQIWPKNRIDAEYTVMALKAVVPSLVEEKHNSQRLASHIREVAAELQANHPENVPPSCEDIRNALPKELQVAIDVTEKTTLQVKKG